MKQVFQWRLFCDGAFVWAFMAKNGKQYVAAQTVIDALDRVRHAMGQKPVKSWEIKKQG